MITDNKPWFKVLKFKYNPLDIRPNLKLVGLDREVERLKSHIIKEEVCFLNGLTGTGKSSMLLKIQNELPNHKFIYLDAQELPDEFHLEDELKNSRGFFDKLLLRDFPKKNPVLIIDEFQATSPELVLEARAKWEKKNNRKIRSIVVAQISKIMKNVTPAFKERIGSRTITLRPLDQDEMKDIIRIRLYHKYKNINYINKISDDALSLIVKYSGNNPRRLLEYVDELFDFHHRKFGKNNPILTNGYKISYHGAKEILGLRNINLEGFENLDAKDSEENQSTAKAILDVNTLNMFFSNEERKIIRCLKIKALTVEKIAKRTKLSKSMVIKTLSTLRKKKGLISAGKEDRKKLWTISPELKRVLVKV